MVKAETAGEADVGKVLVQATKKENLGRFAGVRAQLGHAKHGFRCVDLIAQGILR